MAQDVLGVEGDRDLGCNKNGRGEKKMLCLMMMLMKGGEVFEHRCVLEFMRLLTITEGRDKLSKCVQYAAKFLLAWNAKRYEGGCATVLAKKLSEARKVLKLFRFLGSPIELKEAWKEGEAKTLGNKLEILSIAMGMSSAIIDDVCWAADTKLLPSWMGKFDTVGNQMWLLNISINIPLNATNLYVAYNKYKALLQTQQSEKTTTPLELIELHNARVKVYKLLVGQVKLTADFFHASRLTLNWPTKWKGQDAIFGFISASISLYKLTKPTFLQPQPFTAPVRVKNS